MKYSIFMFHSAWPNMLHNPFCTSWRLPHVQSLTMHVAIMVSSFYLNCFQIWNCYQRICERCVITNYFGIMQISNSNFTTISGVGFAELKVTTPVGQESIRKIVSKDNKTRIYRWRPVEARGGTVKTSSKKMKVSKFQISFKFRLRHRFCPM